MNILQKLIKKVKDGLTYIQLKSKVNAYVDREIADCKLDIVETEECFEKYLKEGNIHEAYHAYGYILTKQERIAELERFRNKLLTGEENEEDDN